MDVDAEIRSLLKEHGAVLERTKKHKVWSFPDGRIWVEGSTPSDVRAARNNLSDLRKMLGVKREIRKNPERKHKTGVNGKQAYQSELKPHGKKNPFTGFVFRSLTYHYDECYPVRIESVLMTPLWCILRNLIGYGGTHCPDPENKSLSSPPTK